MSKQQPPNGTEEADVPPKPDLEGLGWWARRKATKLWLKEAAERSKLRTAERSIKTKEVIDAYEEKKSTREEKKTSRAAQKVKNAAKEKWANFRKALAERRPFLSSLVMAISCGVVALAGQVMFYWSLPWPLFVLKLLMVVMLPVIVEGGQWTSAIHAEYLASKGLPFHKDVRRMWLFSFLAAAMNGYHGAVGLKDNLTGIALGSASVLGPFLWHRYVKIREDIHEVEKKGITPDAVKARRKQTLHHPWLKLSANRLWAAAGGHMTSEMAWRITWERKYGAAPGMARRDELVPARMGWLFRLIFGRVVNPALIVNVSTTTTATAVRLDRDDATREAVAERLPQPSATDLPALPATPATGQPATPGETIPEGWAEDVGAYLAAWSATPDATATPNATATTATLDKGSSDGVAQPPATLDATPETPVEQPATRNPQPVTEQVAATPEATSGATPDKIDGNPPGNHEGNPSEGSATKAADWVAVYFRNAVAGGAEPENVSATEAAKYAAGNGCPVTRQGARKTLDRLVRAYREAAARSEK